MQLDRSVFTEEAFKEWVLSAKDDYLMGYPKDRCFCPLARFLKKKHNNRLALKVEQDKLVVIEDSKRVEEALPDWATALIDYVDNLKLRVVKAKHLKEYYGAKA